MKRRTFLNTMTTLGVGAFGASTPLSLLAGTAPGAGWHVVHPGETLSEIAVDHGVSVTSLKEWNALPDDRIRPGQRLRLRPKLRFLKPEALAVSQLDASRWKHLIIHHSATPSGNAAKFDAYHRRERRMENGLAYHFLIGNGTDSDDGEIEIGHRWTKQLHGGHVTSLTFNDNSLGICLVGNFEKQRPTERQMVALIELLGHLKNDLLGGKPTLLLHHEVKGEQTLCPGRSFPSKHIHRLFG
jgi:LysM repeat protein